MRNGLVKISVLIGGAAYLAAEARLTGPRLLLPDEQKHIGRATDEIDHWLAKHPDVASEAERIRNGEDWTQWAKCHACEAWDKVRELERTINALGKINRNNRTEDALHQIDRALEHAREKLKHLRDILKGTEKADKNAPPK